MIQPVAAAPFEMRLIQRGARLRRSPYFEATRRHGCRAYTVYNHMFLPSYYDDPVSEYWHLLEHVTLWDVSVERQVEITGPDAFRFTSLLTPRDLSRCRIGQGRYVVITAPDGGIINDPVLMRLGENHFWLAVADSDVLLWAKGVATHAGLRVRIQEPDVSPLQVQGPKSKPLMQTLFGDRVLEMRYYNFFEANLDGIPVVVTRTGWSGEVGYEIYLREGSRGPALWERIMTAGAPYNIRPTGPSDIRRIEAGLLNYGADMTLENNPFEVGLDRLVELDKDGEFIGRDALARLKNEGPARKLVGVEIHADPLDLNETAWPVRNADGMIGAVTSVVFSPRLKRNIGYAMVPIDHAHIGRALWIEAPVGQVKGTVVPLPFVDPKKEIPKS